MIINCFTHQSILRHLICRNFKTVWCCSLYHQQKPFKEGNSFKFSLNDETIRLLEKLALVNFESRDNVNIVESAIEFAHGINFIDTNQIEPLVTVLEDRSLKLREDLVTDTNLKKEVLRNAAIVEEDYFVAPPGNIPVNLQNLKNS